MTTKTDIIDAAFWGERVCLDCLAIAEETDDECPECGGRRLPTARDLVDAWGVLERVEESGDDN